MSLLDFIPIMKLETKYIYKLQLTYTITFCIGKLQVVWKEQKFVHDQICQIPKLG